MNSNLSNPIDENDEEWVLGDITMAEKDPKPKHKHKTPVGQSSKGQFDYD